MNTACGPRLRTKALADVRWRSSSRRTIGSRPIVPWSIRSPQRLPTAYPMLSPITAPRIAAAIITGSGIRPAAAATPPKITAISPGNRNPMNAEDSNAGSRKTASNAAQPGSASNRSGIEPVIVPAG